MLKLLPLIVLRLAALRRIFNQCDAMTKYLYLPLDQAGPQLESLFTRERPLTLSGQLLWYVPTVAGGGRPCSDLVMFQSQSLRPVRVLVR